MSSSYLPITKVVATFLASGIAWVAVQLGVDIGSDAVNEAAIALVGVAVGYLTPDARVK